jgi:hypothetical protein
MPPPNTEIPHDLRITIVVLRHLCGWKFQEIADKIELECRTVTQIFNRAKERTPEGLQDSFMELIKHVDPKKTSRPTTYHCSEFASVTTC